MGVVLFATHKSIRSSIAAEVIIVRPGSDIDLTIGLMDQRDEEFCHCFRFTRTMLNRWCYRGFLPMSLDILGIPLFSLKLHAGRVLLPPGEVRAKTSLLRKFRDYRLSIDTAFDECVEGIKKSYPDSWLTDPLLALFRKARDSGKVRLRSVELWKGDRLVAGEIGYTVGACYTSLSGFHTESSSGTAQLYALGKLLAQNGFLVWDLGMYMPYKIAIGGQVYGREAFMRILASVRDLRKRLRKNSVRIEELL